MKDLSFEKILTELSSGNCYLDNDTRLNHQLDDTKEGLELFEEETAGFSEIPRRGSNFFCTRVFKHKESGKYIAVEYISDHEYGDDDSASFKEVQKHEETVVKVTFS